MSRLPSRLLIGAACALRGLTHWRRRRPAKPQRILIAHHLLLGDTLMLTPLLAKLRREYPAAHIAMTMQKPVAPLYAGRPYGVEALPYHPGDPASVAALLRSGPYDLALVPGDNRYSWLAYAMGAGWIRAFAGDRPAYKSWPVDELISYPAHPSAWPDMNTLLVDGPALAPGAAEDWPAPVAEGLPALPESYVVFHLGASSPLKLWPAERWQALAAHADAQGFAVVWSAGPGEEPLVREVDADGRYTNLAGRLDLAQLWHLLKGARALVCPDTGVAHLARITHTPTLCLYGPGSVDLFAHTRFWPRERFHALSAPVACRDQTLLFKRDIPWVRRCSRTPAECDAPRCMQAIGLDEVREHLNALLNAEAAQSGDDR